MTGFILKTTGTRIGKSFLFPAALKTMGMLSREESKISSLLVGCFLSPTLIQVFAKCRIQLVVNTTCPRSCFSRQCVVEKLGFTPGLFDRICIPFRKFWEVHWKSIGQAMVRMLCEHSREIFQQQIYRHRYLFPSEVHKCNNAGCKTTTWGKLGNFRCSRRQASFCM